MNFMPEQNKRSQSVVIRDRKTMEIDGVSDVCGFDESNVTLESDYGRMTVEGEGLHITHLDLEHGKLSLEGKIYGFFYADEPKRTKGGLFARVWK